MSQLWTSAEMIDAMAGRPIGTMPEGVNGISIDTRTLAPGDAFFAIRGDRFDGHDFATAAIKAGAALLVVAEGKLPALGRLQVPMIVVDDVLGGLGRLASAARARARSKVIAVTGSVGKTTTKEALRHVLSGLGSVHASEKSFNNHWGVPLTLARLRPETDFAVFEIGMNHPDEIRPLVGLVRPHVAIVTLIAPAHLGNFANLEEVARAKAEIFEGVVEGGHALINRDDDHFRLLSRLAREAGVTRVTSFGEAAGSDYRLLEAEAGPDRSTIRVKARGKEVAATVGAPGRHIVQNALAVIGACDLVGADLGTVTERLAGLAAEKGRGQRHALSLRGGGATLIDESYNANPVSMKAALDMLAATPAGKGGRRIAVLGDMLELGEHSEHFHAGLADAIAGRGIGPVFLAGPGMQALAAALGADVEVVHRPTAAELGPLLVSSVKAGDVVMVKASNSMGFSALVQALAEAFRPAAKPSKAVRTA